jgi:DNA-binding PadR family transcriptional regulator
MSTRDVQATHYEATVLSLIERMQPITAYQVRKVLTASPTTDISSSTGKIYPIVRRLKERGLVAADPVEGDQRNAEKLRCTDRGKQVLRQWVMTLDDSYLLPEDPLRTRILSFHLLSKVEQVRWLKTTRADLAKKQEQIEAFALKYPGPIHDLAHASARLTTAARLAWIDAILKNFAAK